MPNPLARGPAYWSAQDNTYYVELHVPLGRNFKRAMWLASLLYRWFSKKFVKEPS